MDDQSIFEEMDTVEKVFIRRRKLLPIWIKIFVWIFMIMGATAPLAFVAGLFIDNVNLAIYGINATESISFAGILVTSIFISKGIVAYGLWFEKNWAVTAAYIDGIAGVLICILVMLIMPLLVIGPVRNFSIRFEIILLIPYIIKMDKIQYDWENNY